jgi:hypothetical protein
VFPVEEVDHFFKENGMPTAGEMHQAPLNRIREVTGADAVLLVTLEQYGSHYHVLNSTTVVKVRAQLVDTHTQVTRERQALSRQGCGAAVRTLQPAIQ